MPNNYREDMHVVQEGIHAPPPPARGLHHGLAESLNQLAHLVEAEIQG